MATTKSKDYYQILKSQGLSDKEIAENFVIPIKRTKKQKKEDNKILMKFVNEKRALMTDEEKKMARELQQKFQKEDNEKKK